MKILFLAFSLLFVTSQVFAAHVGQTVGVKFLCTSVEPLKAMANAAYDNDADTAHKAMNDAIASGVCIMLDENVSVKLDEEIPVTEELSIFRTGKVYGLGIASANQ